MKFALTQLLALSAAVALAVAVGHGLTASRWGEAGISAMWAAAVICWIGAAVAAIPPPIVARYAPAYVGQAVFAGTAIRLLVTGALAAGYQTFCSVHLRSFLAWLVILYLILLVLDTIFGVIFVRRATAASQGGR